MILESEPTETTGWQEGTEDLEVVLKRLPLILNRCNKSAVMCKSSIAFHKCTSAGG